MAYKRAKGATREELVERYRAILQNSLQDGSGASDSCDRVATESVRDVTASLNDTPYVAAFQLATGTPGLREAVLARAQESQGARADIMAMYLSTHDVGVREESVQWLRQWWNTISSERRAEFLKRSFTEPAKRLHWWLYLEATEDSDLGVFLAAIRLFEQRIDLAPEEERDEIWKEIASRVRSWLESPVKGDRTAGFLRGNLEKIGPFLGSEMIPLARLYLQRYTKARSAHNIELTCLPMIDVGKVARLAIDAGDPETGDFLLAVMKIFTGGGLEMNMTNSDGFHTMFKHIMSSDEGIDLAKFVPEEERPALRTWVTAGVKAAYLTNTTAIWTTWLKTDPDGFLPYLGSVVSTMCDLGCTEAALVGSAIVKGLPSGAVPVLLDRLRHQEDELFLPVLAAAAETHKGVVPLRMFERLVNARDGRYRAIGVMGLESVADEPVGERDGSPTGFRIRVS